MEFRHLDALAAIRDEGSFVDAAFELGYVQSAVSQQISQLERIVGVRLVNRKRGASSVELTRAGDLLLRHFDQIRGELDRAQVRLDEVRSGQAGLLRIGAPDCVATRLMPAILRRIARHLPRLNVSIEAGSDRVLADHVARGDLDVAFGQLPLPTGPFSFEPLLEDPYVLVVPASWSIASDKERVALGEVAELPFVGSRDGESDLCGLLCDQSGVEISYSASGEGYGSTQAMVAAGIGAAIVPRMALDLDSDAIAALDLDDVPSRTIAVYWRADSSKAPGVAGLIEAASRVCGAVRDRRSVETFDAAA